jgi:flagellar biosynthesis/type III secretory pathway protein FliH
MNKIFGQVGANVEIKPVSFARAPQIEEELRRPTWSNRGNGDVHQWSPINLDAPEPQSHEVAEVAEPAPAGTEEAFEEARALGHAEGIEQGHTEGLEAAQADIEAKTEELQSLADTLGKEIEALGRLRQTWMAEAESQMVSLAMDVGQRLAAEAQLGDTDWVAPLIRQAAEALTETDRIICRLSSDLASRLEQADAWPDVKGMIFEIAPEMEPLDLVVESRFGRVDASLKERIEHLERSIRERIDALPDNADQEVA